MESDSNLRAKPKADSRNKHSFPPGFRERFGKKVGENAEVCVLSPLVICADGQTRPKEEFGMLINDQPAEALCQQFDDAVRQMFYRAYTGDERTAELLVSKFGNALMGLRKLVDDKRDMMRAVAERSPRWPVMLSPDPEDILRTKKRLAELKVGLHTAPPPALAEKSETEDYWENLARRAFEACELNRHLIPVFLGWTEGCHAKKRSINYWDRKVETTFYHLPNGRDVIAIADWQLQCAGLPAVVDSASFAAWWNVIVRCALEHWHSQPAEYAEALNNAAKASYTEFQRRKAGLKKLAVAFKRAVGLHRSKVTARV